MNTLVMGGFQLPCAVPQRCIDCVDAGGGKVVNTPSEMGGWEKS